MMETVTWAEMQPEELVAPVIDSVTLVADSLEGSRFTEKSFTTTVVMTEDGTPASSKSIRAWVQGEFTDASQTTETARQYLILNLTTLEVDDLQSTPTTFIPIDGTTATIQFGATLGTSGTPDDILPEGTAIQTEIQADNGVAPTPTKESNSVTPIDSHVYGPITAVGTVVNTLFTTNLTYDGAVEGSNIVENGFDGDANTQFSVTGQWAQITKMGLSNVETIDGVFGGNGATPQDIYFYDGADVLVAQKLGHTGGQTTIPLTAAAPVNIEKIRVERSARPGWNLINFNALPMLASTSNTALTVEAGKSLGSLRPGQLITEVGNGDDASGIIREINRDTNIINLRDEQPNWDVGSSITNIKQQPTATMYGLRFNNTNGGYLYRENMTYGTSWTYSVWLKPTQKPEYVLQNFYISDEQVAWYWTGSQYEFDSSGGTRIKVPVPINEWSHLVWSNNNGNATVYLNGAVAGTTPGYSSVRASTTNIGNTFDPATNQSFDGYMSELYHTEEAFPATTFGKYFDGKWGPLDSTVIQAAIQPVTYDWTSKTILTGSWNGNIADLYNGDVAVKDSNGIYDITPGSEITVTDNFGSVSSIGVWFGGQGKVKLTINGDTTVTSPIELGVNGESNLYTFNSSVSNVTSIIVSCAAPTNPYDTGYNIVVYAIEVNDKMLVSQTVGFGTNGFYLPFNSTANIKYSSFATGDFFTGETAAPAFDGDLNTKVTVYGASSGDMANFSWVYPTKIGTVSAVYFSQQAATQNVVITINGSTTNAGGTDYYSLVPKDGTVTKLDVADGIQTIAFTRRDVGNGGFYIHAVEADGNFLIDQDGISNDDSGNGNNFVPVNFVLSSTDEIWSNGSYGSWDSNNPPSNGFDGITLDPYARTQLQQVAGVSFPTISNVTTLNLTAAKDTNNGSIEIETTPGTFVDVSFQFEDSTAVLRTVAVSGITSISGIRLNHNSADAQPRFSSIAVNGVMLTNANVRDNVLDTPMKSYALLDVGTSANLQATSSGTSISYLGESGTNYYYEADGVGAVHTGGSAFNSDSGKVYNFGQQPFASKYNTSVLWSDFYTGPFVSSTAAEAFDGVIGGGGPYIATGSSSTFEVEVAVIESFTVQGGTYTNNSGILEVVVTYLDDTSQTLSILTNVQNVQSIDLVAAGFDVSKGGFKKLVFTGTSDTAGNWGVCFFQVDGALLLDSNEPLADASGNNLFQTWSQWTNYDTLNTAKFNEVKTALVNYTTNRLLYRAALITRLSAAGFSTQELDSIDVININSATTWNSNFNYQGDNIVIHDNKYWYALSHSYNNSPDINDPDDWLLLGTTMTNSPSSSY